MGRFDEAIAAYRSDPRKNATTCPGFNYGSANATAPDLCWARRPNVKVGIGINLEQHVTDDIGLFFRGMYSDGKTEVYSYTSTDRSLSFGTLVSGSAWRRPLDLAGVGFGMGWISQAHADYLRMGGIDGFIGDGNIDPAPESVFDVFYSVSVLSSLWLSADYQRITNPAFNADRGPVNVFGARVHAEF
jgi:carbohydrate-selective porin OprB